MCFDSDLWAQENTSASCNQKDRGVVRTGCGGGSIESTASERQEVVSENQGIRHNTINGWLGVRHLLYCDDSEAIHAREARCPHRRSLDVACNAAWVQTGEAVCTEHCCICCGGKAHK